MKLSNEFWEVWFNIIIVSKFDNFWLDSLVLMIFIIDICKGSKLFWLWIVWK